MSYHGIPKLRAALAARHLRGDKDVDDLCGSDESVVQLYEIDGEEETQQWCEGQCTAFLSANR